MYICFDLYYIKKRVHAQHPSSYHVIEGEAMSNSHKLILGPTPLSRPFNIVFWTDLNIFFEVENDLKCTKIGS